MYHIVICDDEPIFLTQISEMIIDILASMENPARFENILLFQN